MTRKSDWVEDRPRKYWRWFSFVLYLLFTLDILTTLVATALYGRDTEINPIMVWLIERGPVWLITIHLVALVGDVLAFSSVVKIVESARYPYDIVLEIVVEVWLGLLLAGGIFIVANYVAVDPARSVVRLSPDRPSIFSPSWMRPDGQLFLRRPRRDRATTMDFTGVQEATICHLLDGDPDAGVDGIDRVLLMRKKRGVGAGLYNGPGGKVEPGESPRACAVREAREELRVDVHSLEKVGELGFAFGGEPTFYCHVYRSADFTGPAEETPEADPAWFQVEDLPYDEMWEDDRHWFPLLLEGRPFRGLVAFDVDGERMEACRIDADVPIDRADGRTV